MKLLLVATLVGFAVALGLISVDFNSASGTGGYYLPNSQPNQLVRSAAPSTARSLQNTSAHNDATTTEKPVYLNQKVIDGEPTLLCTEDNTVLQALKQAVEIWNEALSGALSFDQDLGPFAIHTNKGRAPSSCADDEPNIDVDVVVVYEKGAGNSVYDSRWSDVGEPPRKLFETDTQPAYLNTEHATIVLRNRHSVSVSTLVHELGHVLGLRDYGDCNSLRIGTSRFEPTVTAQHYALMYNAGDRDCRPTIEEAITDRDLRDLYEAYHVGAVANITLVGDVVVGAKQIGDMILPTVVEVTLDWGADGIEKASHGASQIAVLRQDRGSDIWHLVHQASIRDELGVVFYQVSCHSNRRRALIHATRAAGSAADHPSSWLAGQTPTAHRVPESLR